MTDMDPEVMNALVRLMNREVDYAELDEDALFALGAAAKDARLTLHEVTVELNRRGITFAQMATRWGVDDATPTRWMKEPKPPGRRPQGRDEDDDDAAGLSGG